VTVMAAVDVEPLPEPEVSVAVMVALTVSAVRYGGGVYWPLASMLPAPVLGLIDQLTLAEPPLLSVAVNCSMGVPDEFLALQPVQLVSTVAVPGETENVLLEELLDAKPPPQPADKSVSGRPAIANARANHWPIPEACEMLRPGLPVRLHAVGCSLLSLKSSGAFLVLSIARL
jgi:hypothetical protein